MTQALLLMLLFIAVLLVYTLKKKDGSHLRGLQIGYKQLINMLPQLLLAFTLAGLLQVILPEALIQEWLGTSSGLKGILLGSLLGALVPGGPYTALVIIAAVVQGGAGLATTVALVTSWAVVGTTKLPFEFAILGNRMVMIRLGFIWMIPIIGGLLTDLFFT
jgi:uncharacterized membrane protein YraQ (UPF0718 family)